MKCASWFTIVDAASVKGREKVFIDHGGSMFSDQVLCVRYLAKCFYIEPHLIFIMVLCVTNC